MQKLTAKILLLSNVVPLAGVLALGWPFFDILFFYWLEACFLCGNTLLRALKGGEPHERDLKPMAIPLMGVLYFIWLTALGLGLLALFGGPVLRLLPDGLRPDLGSDLFAVWHVAPVVTAERLGNMSVFWLASIFMVSLVCDGMADGHRRSPLMRMLVTPFPYMVFVFGVLLVGGGMFVFLNLPQPMLGLVVIAKILVDAAAILGKRAPFIVRSVMELPEARHTHFRRYRR